MHIVCNVWPKGQGGKQVPPRLNMEDTLDRECTPPTIGEVSTTFNLP